VIHGDKRRKWCDVEDGRGRNIGIVVVVVVFKGRHVRLNDGGPTPFWTGLNTFPTPQDSGTFFYLSTDQVHCCGVFPFLIKLYYQPYPIP